MSQEARESFYLTTPIYYVNAAPHLGTAYTTLLGDIQARYQRSCGKDVRYLTGLDEHGEKVAITAESKGLEPQAWCDSMVPAFKNMWERLNIHTDDFIRTTEPRHTRAVAEVWKRMQEGGHVYLDSYDGWYCVFDETYFTETQVRHSDEENHCEGEHLCPDCHRPLQRVQEESWFFRLSAFEDKLLKLYEENPGFIEPEERRREVISFVKSGLRDLSVSRTSFDWGVPVPFSEGHVTYVWFDALTNYLTSVGFASDDPAEREEFARRWPAQIHLVGKDIIRFHCVIWPAMLMAMGLEVPKKVFAHGFLLVRNDETGRGEKMSKSRGNAISPDEVIDMLGVDGYRYYFARDVQPGLDGAISFARMEQVYNADLANSWGNLCSRALAMSIKYFDGKTPSAELLGEGFALDSPLRSSLDETLSKYCTAMDELNYPAACDAVMDWIREANLYIENSEPWSLAKDEAKAPQLAQVLVHLLETIRICAHLLEPFMPETSAEVLRRLSLAEEISCTDLHKVCSWGGLKLGLELHKGEALFPRLQAK